MPTKRAEAQANATDSSVEDDRTLFDRARRSREGLLDESRLTAEVERAGLDAVIASSQVNATYTSGVYLGVDAGTPVFVVTTASGERAAVVNEADEGFLRQHLPDTRSFRFEGNEEEDAVALLRDVLHDLGLLQARVALELRTLPSSIFDLCTESCADVKWSDAKTVFQRARLIKTPAEIELLHAAARATDRAVADALESADESITEKGLAARIQANALLSGADGLSHTNVNAGVHSTLGHVTSLEDVIRPGEVVYVDFGAKFAGYCTDLARNAVMGTPLPAQLDIYDRMYQVHLNVIDWLKPGIAGAEVFDRGQAEYAKVGLEYPWGTFGHSIGLDMHEGFEFSRGSGDVLEPGMVVCFELTHTEPGGRYHVEDMLLIEGGGCAPLSDVAGAVMRSIGR